MSSIIFVIVNFYRTQVKYNYLSEIQMSFLQFFNPFLKFTSKFKHFEKIQYSKSSQRTLKSARTLNIFSITLREVGWKMFFLVIREILGLFVNTLPADDMYSLRNSDILRQTVQTQLSKKRKKLFKPLPNA